MRGDTVAQQITRKRKWPPNITCIHPAFTGDRSQIQQLQRLSYKKWHDVIKYEWYQSLELVELSRWEELRLLMYCVVEVERKFPFSVYDDPPHLNLKFPSKFLKSIHGTSCQISIVRSLWSCVGNGVFVWWTRRGTVSLEAEAENLGWLYVLLSAPAARGEIK